MALSATPSSMPAKIRNSVAAKCQVNSNSARTARRRCRRPRSPRPDHCAPAAVRRSNLPRRFLACPVCSATLIRQTRPGSSADARRFDAGRTVVQSVEHDNREGFGVISKWLGPLALLAVLVIGDQIRINRPGHKYRLTVEVETPDGIKSASGVMAVMPDRGYSRGGHTATSGDALFVDLGGGKNLVALLAHLDHTLDLDGMNYVALRAYGAASAARRVVQRDEPDERRRAGDGSVDPGACELRRSGRSRDHADRAAGQYGGPVLGNGFRLHGVRPKWCRTGFGRSISAACSASPSRGGSKRSCRG